MKYNYVILLGYSVGKIIKIRLSKKQKQESKKYYDFESYQTTLEERYGFRLLDIY